MGYTYFQFVVPIRNPSEINCLLPPAFLHSPITGRQLQRNDTIALLFVPVTVRTSLMLVALAFYAVIFILSTWIWASAGSFVPGIELLQQIGSRDVRKILKKLDRQLPWTCTDLHLIMGLTYVNRDRLHFIQYVYRFVNDSNCKMYFQNCI